MAPVRRKGTWPFLHALIVPLLHVLCWIPPSGGSATCPSESPGRHPVPHLSLLFFLVSSKFMLCPMKSSLPKMCLPTAEQHSGVGQRGTSEVRSEAWLPHSWFVCWQGFSLEMGLCGRLHLWRRLPFSGDSAAVVQTDLSGAGSGWYLPLSSQLRGTLWCSLPTCPGTFKYPYIFLCFCF